MASCPKCERDVDPLRAPAVRVIEGKVVAFCSAACAGTAPRAPLTVKSGTGSASVAGTIRPRGTPITVPPPVPDDEIAAGEGAVSEDLEVEMSVDRS